MSDDLKHLFLNQTPLLDVRAPIEFSKGAFPNASNLPLLDDLQREQIGICYKKNGHDAAVALGHELFEPELKNIRIRSWTEYVAQHPDCRLYCFRGGLRSATAQQWLIEAGYSVQRVAGGYKRMRQFLIDEIDQAAATLPLLVLAGRTGTGKTRLLIQLASHIDLEGLANHRGSSFGRLLEPQPGNIDFENNLAVQILNYRVELGVKSQKKPLVVEDEAKLIGRVALPASLKERMSQTATLVLDEPIERRIAVVKADYIEDLSARYCVEQPGETGLKAFADYHRDSLKRISKRLGGARTQDALKLFNGAFERHRLSADLSAYDGYISLLLNEYYDPMYDYQMASKTREELFRGTADEIREWYLSEKCNLDSGTPHSVSVC